MGNNMTYCPECGEEIKGENSFCPLCGASLRNRKDTGLPIIPIGILVILIIIAGAGGYILLSGPSGGNGNGGTDGDDGNPSEIHSIDLKIKGFEGGMFQSGFRYRAKEIDSEQASVRIDSLEDEEYLLYNGEENSYYACSGESCTEIPNSQGNVYSGLSEKVKQWAQKGEGTHELSYQEWKVEVIIEEVNPDLPEDLFSPP